MKKTIFTFVRLAFVIFLFAGLTRINAQSTVTFQLDMSATSFEPGTEIGIRGSMAPLSWSKSYPMTDPDNDGIYTVTLKFDAGMSGNRVLYKYMADDTWDCDRFMQFGNRVVTLSNCPQVLPVDTWDVVRDFAFESKLEQSNNQYMDAMIYLIADGKKRGESLDKILSDFAHFWDDQYAWATSPEVILNMEEFNQSKYPEGYFEIVQESPEKVVFRMKKNWAVMLRNWVKEGEFKGVTADDLSRLAIAYYQDICRVKGWTIKWKDEEDDLTLITISVN